MARFSRFFHRAVREEKQNITENSLRLKKVAVWSVEEVCFWLTLIDLGEYKKIFAKEQIDGETLVDLDENDFATMGVNIVGHRAILKRNIKKLVSNNSKYSFDPTTHVYLKVALRKTDDPNLLTLVVNRNINFDELITLFQEKYQGVVIHKFFEYTDADRDVLKIANNSQLLTLLQLYPKEQEMFLSVYSIDSKLS